MRRVRFLYPESKTKVLTMSYDDGKKADYRLVGIFNKYGIRGTFHLNSGNLGKDGWVKSEDVKELYSGHEVSCHTVTHPFLERVSSLRVVDEVWEDRRNLERLCGYPVTGMSYPMGTYNSEIVKQLEVLGIEYCRTTVSTEKLGIPDNFLMWHPTCHHANDRLMELADQFINSKYTMPVFYVWGHSYEFEREEPKNNWGIIEEFCRKVSGKDDVWYATNMEIVRYICAMRSLIFNVDNTQVYNPTCQRVWFTCDEKTFVAEPGKVTCF
ncbi:MAG: polysaccharide deacetylase family protein [Lentisphaeria bacterium]|nr:polysaccharide deacetylase family protein [Lentisphaeria bacterium]